MIWSLFWFIFFSLGGAFLYIPLSKAIGQEKASLISFCLIAFSLVFLIYIRKKEQEIKKEDETQQDYIESEYKPERVKVKKYKAPLPPVVKAIFIWTVFYCVLILLAAFGDMSSSFYLFFKVISFIFFAFLAILYFSRGRLVPILIGFFNAGIAVFFINSFAEYYRPGFWKVFDLCLLAVVVLNLFIPAMLGKRNLD